jgi:excinuclease ABC subunit B
LEDRAWRISLFGDEVESITEFDPLTGEKTDELKLIKVYSNSHYVTPKPTLQQAVKSIKAELKQRLEELYNSGRLLEAQRLEQRTVFDMEMMEATGSCAGIENYSRYLTGRQPGEPPPTLFEYLPDNALVFVDESHVTVPQIGGMFRGDYRRKATLAEYGFPPALLHGQPPAALRGVERHAPADGVRLGHARRLGAGAGPAAPSSSRSSARPA